MSGKGQGQPARVLEESGCAVGCMTIDKRNGDIIVARDDAVYFYRPPGRGPCFAFQGPKSLVNIYKDYLILISPPRSSTLSKSASVGALGRAQSSHILDISTIAILETDLKFVAHSEVLESQVKTLFMEWGELFALTLDGKVYVFLILEGRQLMFTALSIPRKKFT